ncbi:MAG: DUF4270 domain-containing protein [Candidatus Azobacteroides sp.]|nr:DUF4270 domain-containing protein [Candidatus Azobacteroides sp.]
MKIKSLIVSVCTIVLLFSIACNDDLSTIGFNVQPPEDNVPLKIDTIALSSSTFKVDSIYAKSNSGLLGNFDDPVFGSLKSDYMCQFYCPEGNFFRDSVINNQIDSIDVMIFYRTAAGDTLAPMQLSAYKVSQPLTNNFYTNINPDDYCDMSSPLGTQAYTASGIGMRDSLIYSSSAYTSTSYKYIRIRLPKAVGQDIYDKSKTDGIFASPEVFNNYFPGVYFTTTYGTGNIIEVLSTNLNIYYTKYNRTSAVVKDTISTLIATKEIIQMNHFENSGIDDLLVPNETTDYIKTPAGIFTEIEIPMDEINAKIQPKNGNFITNGVGFNVKVYAMPEDAVYPLSAPPYMMIILADEYKDFFENYKRPVDINSFIGTYIAAYNATGLVYKFNNLTPLIKKINENGSYQGGTVKAYLIPVSINIDSNGNVNSIGHYLNPSAVRIRKDKQNINFTIIHSEF